MRALCHILVACLTAAGGRVDDARAELALAEALDSTWGLEMRALFASLPFFPAPEGEIGAIRDALERWDARSLPPSNFLIFAMHNDLHPGIRAWLLGLLELRLGNSERATKWAEELARLEQAGGGLVCHMLAELRAAIARAEGRPGRGAGASRGRAPGALVPSSRSPPPSSRSPPPASSAPSCCANWGGPARPRGGTARSRSGRRYELIYARAAADRLMTLGLAVHRFHPRLVVPLAPAATPSGAIASISSRSAGRELDVERA